MSDHIPDAGKKVCPHCGAELHIVGMLGNLPKRLHCGNWNQDNEHAFCLILQRDQLRARVEDLEAQIEATAWHYTPAMAQAKIQQLNKQVEELEGWCERMANMLEEEGWESTAQNEFRKYMEAKPEGLR